MKDFNSSAMPQTDRGELVPGPYDVFIDHSSATRVATEVTILHAIRQSHPRRHVSVTDGGCDLIAYASAGKAKATLQAEGDKLYSERIFQSPGRRSERSSGTLKDRVMFGEYAYEWEKNDFTVFYAQWVLPFRGSYTRYFIIENQQAPWLAQNKGSVTDKLISAATLWCNEIHDEIYVYDQSMWTKSKDLWKSVQKSTWEDVILDEPTKQVLMHDIEGFYDREDAYEEFGVPWKRGVILHGSPGNGKTISIKAIMNSLSKRKDPIPTLYVKSFTNCHGPEHSIAAIFMHARNMAPCLLVFEDLDSLVTEKVRSYFLNQVDGLEANNGVLMLGSTNHLDRLDPAIAKRPSRFDRKYHFKLPAEAERTAYCEFWRKKLTKNRKVHFPAELCPAIAKITEGFSFAYLKELFITALLIIVGDGEAGNNSAKSHELAETEKDPLDACSLGRVMKKEAQTLKDEMNSIKTAS